MIKVHVWDSAWLRYLPGGGEGSPGHAAIEFAGRYVSFWPGEEVGALKWKGHKLHTFEEDDTKYKNSGQKHWEQIVPDDAGGRANGLDETLMESRFIDLIGTDPDYTATLQCAAVVNDLLIAGGARQFLAPKLFRPSTWYVYAVSPADVKDYVTALVKAMKSK